MRRLTVAIAVLLIFAGVHTPAWGRCFRAPPPVFFICSAETVDGINSDRPSDDYICSDDLHLTAVGGHGKPDFQATLTGHCGIQPGAGLPGWSPVAWKRVTFHGRYDYDTQRAHETVREGAREVLVAELRCRQNPWSHTPDCDFRDTLVNKTGAQARLYFPISAHSLSPAGREAIAAWEAQPTRKPLSIWNPYDVSGPPDLAIGAPQSDQVLTAGDAFLSINAVVLYGAIPDGVEFRWHQIVPIPKAVGHMAQSAKETHDWKPFNGPGYAAWEELPLHLPLHSGVFAGQQGLFELRIKKIGEGPWSAPVRFWIGAPNFDPPAVARFKAKSRFKRKLIRNAYKMNKPVLPAPQTPHARVNPTDLKPKLQVVGLDWSPSVLSDDLIDLFVQIRNQGGAANQPGLQQLFVACAPEDACDTLIPLKTIEVSLKPGDQEVITVAKALRRRTTGAMFSVSTYPLTSAELETYLSKQHR